MIMISSATNLVTENGKLSDNDNKPNENNDIYNDNLNDNNNNNNNNNYYYNEDVQTNFDEDFDSFFWHGRFIPPPPRPPYLNDDVTSDGPTTCGLCTWSQYKSTHSFFDAPFDAISELGLPIILIIVALLSAIFGAIGMITFIKCKRKRKLRKNEIATRNSFRHHHHQQQQQQQPQHQQLQFQQCEHQCCQLQPQQQLQCREQMQQQNQQPHLEHQPCTNGKCLFDNCTENNNEHNQRNPEVWIWLKNVNTSMNLDESLIAPQITSQQNYYTNTDGPPQIRQNEAVYEEITGVG